MIVRSARPSDAFEAGAVHAEGLATGHASFRDVPLDADDWAAFPLCLVAEDRGLVAGWAAVAPSSSRETYRGVGEVSLYVASRVRGRGVGARLLAELVDASEMAGWWTLAASIFPENEGSLKVFGAAGFREVGRRARIGRMAHGPFAGRWRDTVLLERRSGVVGR
ncbi:N-acetyltransferase [Jannaschia sp. Os4]|uniref:GNAT family N-acetyltransferase n=1 Tax=Jannaschia sp. Os4 TaxID=2807617 RepID=UPI00193ADB1D|nr:GNAT family N-acetyltransferase [Jannaschia sp. Os4]MBM2577024.1 N-acetyltransferase [Jannaschia sp. Os4]